jgi:hypothetical protein
MTCLAALVVRQWNDADERMKPVFLTVEMLGFTALERFEDQRVRTGIAARTLPLFVENGKIENGLFRLELSDEIIDYFRIATHHELFNSFPDDAGIVLRRQGLQPGIGIEYHPE